MTRDDVIRMAKEAGIVSKGLPVGGVKALEAFAKLVAAHESNEWKMKYEHLRKRVPSYSMLPIVGKDVEVPAERNAEKQDDS
jgi:hypothetical protein